MFIARNRVRLHDTDMAGILYFPRQFRFVHDALEDFLESIGLTFEQIFHKEKFIFVVVHAEADYINSLRVGDQLDIHVTVEKIGNTSFTIDYKIYKLDKTLSGTAKTVHVTVDSKTRKKTPIPHFLREFLKAHHDQSNTDSK